MLDKENNERVHLKGVFHLLSNVTTTSVINENIAKQICKTNTESTKLECTLLTFIASL